MSFANSDAATDSVLVSDFDGTMTRYDFYTLVLEKLLPKNTPNYWEQYQAGQITHFDALKGYFSEIRASEEKVDSLIVEMELDPNLHESIERLSQEGWEVVVTSAGCEWYIRKHFAANNVRIPVHANPGDFDSKEGLVMKKPLGSPYLSESVGVDKAAVVRHFQQAGRRVAYAGDGLADLEAARLVPQNFRFARRDLANALRKEKLGYRGFDCWSEIADALLSDGN